MALNKQSTSHLIKPLVQINRSRKLSSGIFVPDLTTEDSKRSQSYIYHISYQNAALASQEIDELSCFYENASFFWPQRINLSSTEYCEVPEAVEDYRSGHDK